VAQALRAIYRNGAFVPYGVFDLPEGTEVELLIQPSVPSVLVSPPISEPAAKRQFLRTLIERMQQNPIPTHAPRLTRDSLHERR
jgi:predicted DNA-binding antitoxin AbrB/MazE fold protein